MLLNKRSPKGYWVFIALFIVLMFASTTFPFYWMVITSLRTENEIFSVNRLLTLKNPTLDNFRYLFMKTDILWNIAFTAIISAVSTILAVIIGGLAAFALTNIRFRFRKAIGLSIFFAYIVPQAILFIPLFLIMNKVRLTNTFIGLLLAYQTFCVPFCAWLLIGYFRTIPVELKDAAIIDGCSYLKYLVTIVVPLSLPGIATASIFSFTNVWNDFLYSAVLSFEPKLRNISVALKGFLIGGDTYLWGPIMAAALLATTPMLVLYFFAQKYVTSGLTLGSVKE